MKDDLRAKAEAAKKWRPSVYCREDGYCGHSDHNVVFNCGEPDCDACLGTRLAVEDIEEHVDDAMRDLQNNAVRPDRPWREAAVTSSERAARIVSYFAAEPNPVSEFRDAVREAVK